MFFVSFVVLFFDTMAEVVQRPPQAVAAVHLRLPGVKHAAGPADIRTAHPRVYLGNKRIDPDTWANYSDNQVHWIRYFFGRTLTGTLRIRGDRYNPVVVDAVAIEH